MHTKLDQTSLSRFELATTNQSRHWCNSHIWWKIPLLFGHLVKCSRTGNPHNYWDLIKLWLKSKPIFFLDWCVATGYILMTAGRVWVSPPPLSVPTTNPAFKGPTIFLNLGAKIWKQPLNWLSEPPITNIQVWATFRYG